MSSMLRRRSHATGPRTFSVVCFDCGAATKAPVEVYRRSDGQPIDWNRDGREGAIVVFVHRAGSGCNRGRTPDEVRTSAAS